MAIIRIPSDQADIASALAAANPGDTIEFEAGLNQTDFTVTVNNLTLNAAGGEDFTVTLATRSVTQVTTTGAGSVEIIGNDDGNTITDTSTGTFFQDITLGEGTDTLIAGRGADVIRVGEGTKAIDLGAFTDVGQQNDDGGSLNLSDTDFVVAETRGTSAITIVNFNLQEDQGGGETDDRLIFGGTTRADFAANAKFFIAPVTNGGPLPGALTSLGGYTDTSDWNLSITFDYDGNGQNDAIFMLHDLFDFDQQTQMRALLTNTDFSPADIGNEVEIAAADEAGFINGVLNPLGNDNIAFALLVDPTRDALNDGQLDVATGLIAYRTITAALAAAGEGDVLVLAPGDHTFTSTVPGVTISTSNITFEPLGAGPDALPAITLATGVQSFQSRLDTGGLEITGSNTPTEVATFETNDFFAGGAGGDSFSSNDGIDTFNGMAGDDTAGYFLSSGGTLTFDGGEGGETEGDTVALIDDTGLNRSVFLNGSTQDGLVADVGLLPNRVTATNVEKFNVNTGGGNDVFTLTGSLSDVGILQANVSTFSLTATIFTTGGNNSFDASGLTSTTGIAFVGAAGNDIYIGSIGGDLLFDQGGGINSFTGGGGDDFLFATGGGTNTAHYALSSENYVVTSINGGAQFQVQALNGNEGTDTLTGITQISFDGGSESGAIESFVAEMGDLIAFRINDNASDDLVFRAAGHTFAILDGGSGAAVFGGFGQNWSLEGVADVNGIGGDDLIFRTSTGHTFVKLDGGGTTAHIGGDSQNWSFEGVADVNGNGSDDLIFRTSTGHTFVKLDGGGTTAHIGGDSQNWSFEGVADVNGNGSDDLIFRTSTGHTFVKLDGGGTTAHIGGDSQNWSFEGVADVNGNGSDDLIFRTSTGHTFVKLDGGGTTAHIGGDSQNWSFEGVADVNGNGSDDLIFRTSTGHTFVKLDGGGTTAHIGGDSQNWSFEGVADVNGNGSDDLIFRTSTGHTFVKLDGGGTTAHIGGDSQNWSFEGVADVNGNGSDDLIFRTSTGHTFVKLDGGGTTAHIGGHGQNWELTALEDVFIG